MWDAAEGRVGVPLYLLAASICLLGGLHMVLDADPLYAEVAEASILFVFGGAIGVVGYRLRGGDASLAESLRVATFVLGGGVIVGTLAALFVALRLLTGEATTELEYILSIGWSVGAAAGAWTGFYFVRMESSLRAQRDLTKRLTVLQRVLRHNLRNEMTVIGGTNRDLRDLVDGREAEGKVETIDRHVRAVARLSEQSQTLTRIWQAEGHSTVDLGEVLTREVDRFRRDHPETPLDADLPADLRVGAHPNVGLAIREAMENAVLHNDRVEVTLTATERDAGSVVVEVADTGSGIPETELRPLWAPGEGPLTHSTGLGLWTIYWLVEASNGEFDVESDADGTTLSMTFRRA